MRVTTAAIIASIVAAVEGLSPSWSFASTTTITDKDTPWYTISAPFLTTITTDVSGTVETITATKVSISIGTEPPSAISPVISTNSPTIPGTGSTSGTMVSARVRKVRGLKAHSPSTSTEELITHTHSHTQSSTIDDSDVLTTTSPITDQSDPTTSSLTTTSAGTTATLNTTTRPTTSVYYHTSNTSKTHCISSSVSSIDGITWFSTSIMTSSDTAYSTSTYDYDETSSSSSSISTMSIPASETPTSWITTDPQSTSNESTTFTTRTIMSTLTATDSSGFSPSTTDPGTSTPSSSIVWSSSPTCKDGEAWTNPSPITYSTPTHNALYNPTWHWGHDTDPTRPPVGDAEPPSPHLTLPFEHPATLHRAQWIARVE
ncbi:hypothetical protein F4782DRAFT_530134 [Xylaria castorea]|nr:hypothetical protein F4782DRAFT_530134 [Xylaria castorea]